MSTDGLIPLEAAWAEVAAQTRPRPPERRPLANAVGFVLAQDLVSDRDLPAADRSSMDGYAFAHTPAARAPWTLKLRGEIQAGSAPAFALQPGECARIFTGALLPPGADTVVMQEDTAVRGGDVELRQVPPPGSYVLRQGTDAQAGDRLVAAGTVLSPLHLALGATAGWTDIAVVPRPRVAVLTTGTELVEAGAPVAPHQIRDSNRILVQARLRAAGFETAAVARTGDDEVEIAAAAERLLAAAEVLILIGGMSVGCYDFAPAALRRLGAKLHFHRVQARPGKPQLFATRSDGLIFGLPGNPLSVLVGLHELVIPALRLQSGFPPKGCRRIRRVRLAEPITGIPELVNFRPAKLRSTAAGDIAEVLASPRSSADLVTAAAADGFVLVPSGVRLEAGAWVEFRPFREEP
jgi:molybdopterin molybdotransferase